MLWRDLADDLVGIEMLMLGDSFNLFILPLEAYIEEYSLKMSQGRSYRLDFCTEIPPESYLQASGE